jgi:hypothetical protein
MTKPSKTDRLSAAKAGGRASAAKRREAVARLGRFRAALLARLGDDAEPARAALVDAACSLYAAILRHAYMSAGVQRKVNLLGLSAATTSFRAVLRDLGVTNTADLTDAPGPSATAEERRQWARKYVQQAIGESE